MSAQGVERPSPERRPLDDIEGEFQDIEREIKRRLELLEDSLVTGDLEIQLAYLDALQVSNRRYMDAINKLKALTQEAKE